MMAAALDGIQSLGGAKVGDKTLVDTLTPAVESLKKSVEAGDDFSEALNKMEEAARKTPGVKNVTVNFMTLKMNVEFEEGQDPEDVMKQVRKNCKRVEDDCEIYL